MSDKGDIIIYPNPATDRIIIENIDAQQGDMISIYDSRGRVIMNQSLKHGRNEIDISGLTEGLFFIKVEDEQGMLVNKFVKE